MSEPTILEPGKTAPKRRTKASMTPEQWQKRLEQVRKHVKAFNDRKREQKIKDKELMLKLFNLYNEGKILILDDSETDEEDDP